MSTVSELLTVEGADIGNLEVGHRGVMSTSVIDSVVTSMTSLTLLGDGRRHCRIIVRMNCLLSSSSISTWGTIKTNTYLYRAIQYLHNGV